MVRFHTIPREEAAAYIFNPVERDAKRLEEVLGGGAPQPRQEAGGKWLARNTTIQQR